MHLTRFYCRSFRCLREIDLQPGPGINLIRGRNAQGKTSLLEAILFAATSKSHRTTVESDLAQSHSGEFHIRIDVQRDQREIALESHWWKGQKRVKINGVAQKRLSDMLGKVSIVLFAPEDIALIKSGSALRRRFLDMALSQLEPIYLAALQNYRQVLRQRNELLRAPRPDTGLLDVWDVQLAREGETVIEKRAGFVADLSKLAAQAYGQIAAGEILDLRYAPDCPSGALAELLRAKRDSDIRRKMTVHGPHRDDLEIAITGNPARSHASQGQQKSAALALRLAEMAYARVRTGELPVLLLDEVLAELDAQRAAQLFDAIPAGAQCFITTTDLARVVVPDTRPTLEFVIEAGSLAPS